MQGGPRATEVTPSESCHPTGAITWIDSDHAVVARQDAEGRVAVTAVRREGTERMAYLERVAHEIGDRERVLIVGPGPLRTALERAYVGTHPRSAGLVDVEPADEMTEAGLIRRLRELAGRP